MRLHLRVFYCYTKISRGLLDALAGAALELEGKIKDWELVLLLIFPVLSGLGSVNEATIMTPTSLELGALAGAALEVFEGKIKDWE